MDIELARTFLEVLTSGNFVNASRRLHVTQSAVSLRIKRLEEELGREVFLRTKTGAELTPAGQQFERFARSLLKVWEEARYHVAVPEGFQDMLIIGSQYSLWPKLTMRWLRLLERQFPHVSLRAEMGMPDRLLRMMLDGVLDIGIMYTPQLRPGLEVEVLMEDTLVLASTNPNYDANLDSDYVFIDWGPEFVQAHQMQYPEFRSTHVSLALGTLAARYVVEHQRAGYFPARFIEDLIANGTLHIVSGAPAFPFPVYTVWNPEKDTKIIAPALKLLRRVAEKVDDDQVDLLEDAGIEEKEAFRLGTFLVESE
ncbi:MAG: LysR family transcriptional regulator [Alphaproteobacteria bacterium]|nr:LysR family transcriptional regulator [Alphaproteobacteria bacterium]MBU0803035.1 LysR family transcriptional regulator [Alphaproteobacteria bacterium]MBU0870854.1 LysR family transcriptional regulator [Alphaproteobacteria bacterium]MBU1403709.1 LysR family transcriptional regulator [Alphaproteobacteria bacterium]MBU1589544.1 LysR family transcriptional regulator [Alphaproteobacteria bacterium]